MNDFSSFKQNRDHRKLHDALRSLRDTAQNTQDSLVPGAFEALEADATFAEVIGVLRTVDGLEYDWAGERDCPI